MADVLKNLLTVFICLSIGWGLSKVIVFFVGYPAMTEWSMG